MQCIQSKHHAYHNKSSRRDNSSERSLNWRGQALELGLSISVEQSALESNSAGLTIDGVASCLPEAVCGQNLHEASLFS